MNSVISSYIIVLVRISLLCIASILLTACDSGDLPEDVEPLLGQANDSQYVAIRIEAENFTGKNERWHVTSQQQQPDVTPDPDPPHFSTASNNGYVELLPDTRVTHADELIGGENFWGDLDWGPALEYVIDVPVAGRYYVYAKAFSTGLEDNGIHVGFKDQKPASGKRIQLCSGKFKWTWTSAQRVPENHCGVEKTIYLDINQAGQHTIVFYAREDGFELDQFILLKDPEGDTEECFVYYDRIRCTDKASGEILGTYDLPFSQTVNGNQIVTPPPPPANVDLEIDLSVNESTARIGDELAFTLNVSNKEENEPATSVVVTATLPIEFQLITSSGCLLIDRILKCELPELTAEDSTSLSFSAIPLSTGELRIDAQVTADQNDLEMGNNAGSIEVSVSPAIPAYDGKLTITHGPNIVALDDTISHLLTIENTGLENLNAVAIVFTHEQIGFSTNLAECSNSDWKTTCVIEEIPANQEFNLPITLKGNAPGKRKLDVSLDIDADENMDDNQLSLDLYTTEHTVTAFANGSLIIEAESFKTQQGINVPLKGAHNSAWFVYTDDLSPTITPDFDSTPIDNVGAEAYVELLPDTRTGEFDPPVLNLSNFLSDDGNPTLSYDAFFNSPGVYTIYARIRANNTEDASIHVGLNGEWPVSSANISVCNPDGTWQWTHKLTINGRCKADSRAQLEIKKPGLHTIHIAPSTDGVEVDKLTLSINTTDQLQGIGGTSVPYEAADIDLALDSSIEQGIYRLLVSNLNESNTALEIEVTLMGEPTDTIKEISGIDSCSHNGSDAVCTIEYILAGESESLVFPIGDSAELIRASINEETDPNSKNDTTELELSGGSLNTHFILLLLILLGLTHSIPKRCHRVS